jgi:hypothetical protein
MTILPTLIAGDVRQILRDKTLLTFTFAPVYLWAFVRFAVPAATAGYPFVTEYNVYIMMFSCVQTSILFGFVSSFLLLEEKDENVLQALRVLPISPFAFLAYRLFFSMAISFVGALGMMLFGGLANPGLGKAALLATQYALCAPFITLILATFAANKIEGMAYFKGVDLLLLLPIVGFFFTGVWAHIFIITPPYWTYRLYERSMNGAPATEIAALYFAGAAAYSIWLSGLFLAFKRRVFDR